MLGDGVQGGVAAFAVKRAHAAQVAVKSPLSNEARGRPARAAAQGEIIPARGRPEDRHQRASRAASDLITRPSVATSYTDAVLNRPIHLLQAGADEASNGGPCRDPQHERLLGADVWTGPTVDA